MEGHNEHNKQWEKWVDKMKQIYHDSEVVMSETLASTKVSDVGDMTFEDAFELYVGAMHWSGDEDVLPDIRDPRSFNNG